MKTISFLLSLFFISATGLSFDFPKINKPASTGSTPSTSSDGKVQISNNGGKQNQLTSELNQWIGKPGDQALAHFRGKYGKEIKYNLQQYYWEVPAEETGMCIQFHILINGPNVGNSGTYKHDCK